jgi:hypothetical protein
MIHPMSSPLPSRGDVPLREKVTVLDLRALGFRVYIGTGRFTAWVLPLKESSASSWPGAEATGSAERSRSRYLAALRWAQVRGDDGVLLLGCDTPLVSETMLRTVLYWNDTAPAVVPVGPQSPEPLCALYWTACASVIQHRLRSKDLSMRGLAQAVGAVLIGEEAVAAATDPQIDFLNVNTVTERDHAEYFLATRR